MTNHLGRCIVDPSFVAVSHTLQWNRCDVKCRMTLHCSIFDVKILMHCINNDCIWWMVTFVFVLRLNPLHVSSCEVVAWLAHLWWRLSCLRQRFSYVTSDAWSRNVIRLCGITVCVSGNRFILLYGDFDILWSHCETLTRQTLLHQLLIPPRGSTRLFTCCRTAQELRVSSSRISYQVVDASYDSCSFDDKPSW